MKRRKAIQQIGIAAGAGVLLPLGIFSGCRSEEYQGQVFSQSQIDLLNDIGETILPETADSPGARAAKVGNFLDSYVAACLPADDQQLLLQGLTTFSESCQQAMGKAFAKCTEQERHYYLVQLDTKSKQAAEMPHYFSKLKPLILFAYFTSKEGATQALRYFPIPGRFKGNYAFAKGDKAWAL